jgi:hypothetical protein
MGGSSLRRIILVMAMLVVMVAMFATPALAAKPKPKFTCYKGKTTISSVNKPRAEKLRAKSYTCDRI